MGACDRGVQTLLTTGGAIAAFTLMSVAVGTDFWLYSRGNCRRKGGAGENETSKKNEDVMTHSGLWRTCCLEGESGSGFKLRLDCEEASVRYSRASKAILSSMIFVIHGNFDIWQKKKNSFTVFLNGASP
uniref:Voltage-dependent calcium channel gamma-2 subunit n=1 Tax=Eptatretus burgeri TaxID=7764 RepID=A0A8C4QR03_EPTBU